jgi:hypothetical protein
MLTMFVTLEVSQLSGWLKARACCQPKGRGMRCGTRCGPRGGRAWGGGGASGVHGEKARLKAWGARGRGRAERTVNMPYMVVTLDVSKFSGWLNFCTPCQPKGGACDMGRGVFCRESKGGRVRCGGRGAGREAGEPAVGSGAAQVGMYTGKVRLKTWGPGHARSAR